ncbi:MAG: signal peptide peptidase SppA [Calditrichia bacterium]|nr:signal peptide peptidase SppA [Calditrichia bacterium]
MSTRGKIIIIISFIILFVIGISIYIKSMFLYSLKGVDVADNSILEIPLVGNMVDRSGDFNPMWQKFPGPSMHGISKSLKMAAKDKRIQSVLLVPNFLSGAGFGKIQELGKMITEFRENSGKKVYAHIEVCGAKEYYLATFCDSVFAVPTGMIIANGMQGSVYYIKEGMDKIGITADFIAIGKYKNAPEMFTRKSISDDQKEVLNVLLDQYYDDYLQTISANRNLSIEKVKELLDIGFFSSEKAKSYGLVDKVCYKHDIYEQLRAVNGKVKKIDYVNYDRQGLNKFYPSSDNQIAVIYAQGTINLGSGNIETQILSESFSKMIRKIKDDKKIKAAVLRIDSPGGSGTASEVVYNALKELREEKPLIVSIADMAASGGYYLAMAGDTIFAEPGSIVGSIGVFAGKFPLGGLYKKLGINKETLKRGKNATFFDEENPFTPSERQVMTEHLEDFYHTFVEKVAAERNKSWDEIHEIAQGRVWTAKDGLENGLVDKFGALKDAVASAKKAAGFLPNENVSVVNYPHIRPAFEKLISKFNFEQKTGILENIADGYPETKYFMQFSKYKPFEPLTILPFYLEIE